MMEFDYYYYRILPGMGANGGVLPYISQNRLEGDDKDSAFTCGGESQS